MKHRVLTPGGKQDINYIPEGDLYRLIVHSRLPAAERFEAWVFDEVLPTIRRTGAYTPDLLPLITQAVQAAVTQTIQALAPFLGTRGCEPEKKRIRRRVTSLADQLETPLRMELEEMILGSSARCTYAEISEHFRDAYGVIISKSSIGRYAQRLFEVIEAEENALSKETCICDSGEPVSAFVDDMRAYILGGRELFMRRNHSASQQK